MCTSSNHFNKYVSILTAKFPELHCAGKRHNPHTYSHILINKSSNLVYYGCTAARFLYAPLHYDYLNGNRKTYIKNTAAPLDGTCGHHTFNIMFSKAVINYGIYYFRSSLKHCQRSEHKATMYLKKKNNFYLKSFLCWNLFRHIESTKNCRPQKFVSISAPARKILAKL